MSSLEDRFVSFYSDGSYRTRSGYDETSVGCQGKSIHELYNVGRAFNFVTSKLQDATGQTSILPNWPDAIRCSSDISGNGGNIFFIHGVSSTPGFISHYVQNSVGIPSDIVFNPDGSYNSGSGYDLAKKDCIGKSIPQLYSEGRAFNFVTSKFKNTTGKTSIVPNWPDVIRCKSGYVGDEGSNVFFVHNAVNAAGVLSTYLQAYNFEDRLVLFNPDGSYNAKRGIDVVSKDCEGKSIQQLYNEGKAFNLVTSTILTIVPTTNITELTPAPDTSAPVTPYVCNQLVYYNDSMFHLFF
jgi:hypothetical protein